MWSTQTVTNNSNAARKSPTSTSSENKTYGMTSAISLADPKPIDYSRTNELVEALKPFNVFESEEELNHRMEILR